jgi:ActR/RegA family two-component response regulator
MQTCESISSIAAGEGLTSLLSAVAAVKVGAMPHSLCKPHVAKAASAATLAATACAISKTSGPYIGCGV